MSEYKTLNWLLMKTVLARCVVDKTFRKALFGDGADPRAALDEAGYPLTDEEFAMISCNTEESFDERFVTIDNFAELWKIAEDRMNDALTGRTAEAGPIPTPGSAEAIAEGV